ncbi:MAG: sarcosine oxidase, gamma subunit [Marinibacterium sp.]|nr:sarcosine oxidase, gamma subunit [Marinibacterium sp.]
MHDLIPLSPLGGAAPQVDMFDGLQIREVTDRALASVAARLGHEAVCQGTLRALIGADLPGPGQSVEGSVQGLSYAAFWTAPETWMIDADHGAHELLAQDLAQALGASASVTEQTDGWCRFDLEGARVCDLLERLCAVDVRMMGQGGVTRTALHHIGGYLWCQAPGRRFVVLGSRSSARSLHHALVETARSITG